MNKRIYRATHVKQVDWSNVIQNTTAKALVLAIDIAKEEQFAMLMDEHHQSLLRCKTNTPCALRVFAVNSDTRCRSVS